MWPRLPIIGSQAAGSPSSRGRAYEWIGTGVRGSMDARGGCSFLPKKDFSSVWSALVGYALIETDVILSHTARSATIVPGCLGNRGLSAAVPEVQIHLSPAVSQQQTGRPRSAWISTGEPLIAVSSTGCQPWRIASTRLGAQDAEVHETTDIAPSYAVALRQFPEHLGAASTRKPKWRGHLSENAAGLMRRACRLFSHHSDQTA
jgi:hypothetical protein